MEGIPGSYYPNASVVVQWSGTMETGVTLGQEANPWAPWWWDLKPLDWIMEYCPGSFYIDALLMVRRSVTIETGLIPVRQEPFSKLALWDKWLLPGPPGGGIWNY